MKKEILEVWKPVPGYEGQYEVSSLGRVKSLERYEKSGNMTKLRKDRIMKQNLSEGKYWEVCLCKNSKLRYVRVHILVLEAFVGPRPLDYHGCHKNDIQTDNYLKKFYWGTPRENVEDALRNKRYIGGGARGEKSPKAILTEEKVRYVLAKYQKNSRKYGALALGKELGVSGSTIQAIIYRISWKHI